jgi:hypothetical protein
MKSPSRDYERDISLSPLARVMSNEKGIKVVENTIFLLMIVDIE